VYSVHVLCVLCMCVRVCVCVRGGLGFRVQGLMKLCFRIQAS